MPLFTSDDLGLDLGLKNLVLFTSLSASLTWTFNIRAQLTSSDVVAKRYVVTCLHKTCKSQ